MLATDSTDIISDAPAPTWIAALMYSPVARWEGAKRLRKTICSLFLRGEWGEGYKYVPPSTLPAPGYTGCSGVGYVFKLCVAAEVQQSLTCFVEDRSAASRHTLPGTDGVIGKKGRKDDR